MPVVMPALSLSCFAEVLCLSMYYTCMVLKYSLWFLDGLSAAVKRRAMIGVEG
jgi:hypothetical protein